jgi:hypothetical protein
MKNVHAAPASLNRTTSPLLQHTITHNTSGVGAIHPDGARTQAEDQIVRFDVAGETSGERENGAPGVPPI